MSRAYGWRASCPAGGVTAVGVGSGAWLGSFSSGVKMDHHLASALERLRFDEMMLGIVRDSLIEERNRRHSDSAHGTGDKALPARKETHA